jgi:hypothetical protein
VEGAYRGLAYLVRKFEDFDEVSRRSRKGTIGIIEKEQPRRRFLNVQSVKTAAELYDGAPSGYISFILCLQRGRVTGEQAWKSSKGPS